LANHTWFVDYIIILYRARRSASGKALVARRYANESSETETHTVDGRRRRRRWRPLQHRSLRRAFVTLTHARALSPRRDGSPRRYARANRNGGAAVPECPPASPTPSSPPAHRPPARSRIRRRLGARFAHFRRRRRRRRYAGDPRWKLSATTLYTGSAPSTRIF